MTDIHPIFQETNMLIPRRVLLAAALSLGALQAQAAVAPLRW